MTQNTVYVIEPSFPCADPVDARNQLGRAIAFMASREGVAVWFHKFSDERKVATNPCVLLECREPFLEKVRALPGYGSDCEIWFGVNTERSDQLRRSFTNRPNTGSGLRLV